MEQGQRPVMSQDRDQQQGQQTFLPSDPYYMEPSEAPYLVCINVFVTTMRLKAWSEFVIFKYTKIEFIS